MATIAPEVGRQVALDRIRVPENVRTLDDAHVQALAGSIKLQGMLVPVVVRDDGDGFARRRLSPHRGRQVARPGRGAGRRPTSRPRTPTGRSRTSRASSSAPTRRPRLFAAIVSLLAGALLMGVAVTAIALRRWFSDRSGERSWIER